MAKNYVPHAYSERKLNFLERLFIYCSGADTRVLMQPNDDIWTEIPKYVSIGAIVFFTSTFAFISMAFAIHSIFKSLPAALFIGASWGSFIFFIDRLFVSGIKKTKYQEKESEILNGIIRAGIDLLKSIPRLVIAVFIGIIIAIPLELRLFSVEIEEQLRQEWNARDVKAIETQLRDSKILDSLLAEIDKGFSNRQQILRDELHKKENNIENYVNKVNENLRAIESSRIIKKDTKDSLFNQNNEYRKQISKLEKEKEEVQKELNALPKDTAQLRNYMERKKTIEEKKQLMLSPVKTKYNEGILARIQALNNYMNDPRNKSTKNAYWAIMLLIIAIETMPVLLKILTGRGIYDAKVELFYQRQNVETIGYDVAENYIKKIYQTIDGTLGSLLQNLNQQLTTATPAQRAFLDKFVVDLQNSIELLKKYIDDLSKTNN